MSGSCISSRRVPHLPTSLTPSERETSTSKPTPPSPSPELKDRAGQPVAPLSSSSSDGAGRPFSAGQPPPPSAEASVQFPQTSQFVTLAIVIFAIVCFAPVLALVVVVWIMCCYCSNTRRDRKSLPHPSTIPGSPVVPAPLTASQSVASRAQPVLSVVLPHFTAIELAPALGIGNTSDNGNGSPGARSSSPSSSGVSLSSDNVSENGQIGSAEHPSLQQQTSRTPLLDEEERPRPLPPTPLTPFFPGSAIHHLHRDLDAEYVYLDVQSQQQIASNRTNAQPATYGFLPVPVHPADLNADTTQASASNAGRAERSRDSARVFTHSSDSRTEGSFFQVC